jgi:predicted RNase H-like HicB family nuclease
MKKVLLKKAKMLSKQEYKITISTEKLSDGRVVYMAKNPDLDGCMAQGFTEAEAISNLEDARIDYIYDALEDGETFSNPTTETTSADQLNLQDTQLNIHIKKSLTQSDHLQSVRKENKISIFEDCF